MPHGAEKHFLLAGGGMAAEAKARAAKAPDAAPGSLPGGLGLCGPAGRRREQALRAVVTCAAGKQASAAMAAWHGR